MPVDEARDLLYAYQSVGMYELLVVERGWPPERYRAVVVDGPAVDLLTPPA